MGTPKFVKDIINDFDRTISKLWEIELLLESTGQSVNKTGCNNYEISWSGKNTKNCIVYDSNILASQLIMRLVENRQYTVLLYDKSIIQAEYIIENNMVIKQRLVFMKKHNKIWDKNEIAEYEEKQDIPEEDWFEEDLGIPIIIRIDYDPNNHIECEHPCSHFTISNNECCRIPIQGIITFSEFVRFIIKNFYGINLNLTPNKNLEETITIKEKEMIYLAWK